MGIAIVYHFDSFLLYNKFTRANAEQERFTNSWRMPFRNQLERDLHFARHGTDFGAADATDYERLADSFMFGVMANDVQECVRPSGIDRVRFGFNAYIQGVACTQPIYIRTLYVVRGRTVRRRGGNQSYFAYECGRINL